MMVMCPWVCYLVAEGLSLSGIVAICTNGVFLNAYAEQNVSRDARRVLRLCYETVAVTAEQIVFLFLGIGLFAFNHPYNKMGFGLALTTVLNLNLARLLNILIVTFLVNCGRSKEKKIPAKMQFIMWLAGLRGAMAYALALKCATDLDVGPLILIDTLIYAFITILGVGSILNPILGKLDVKRKEPAANALDEPRGPMSCSDSVKARLGEFNKSKLAPIFVK